MTQQFLHLPEEGSRLNDIIGSALTGLMLALFGVVSIVSVAMFIHI